eukprot:TRINITY_DN52512_c0_g1_i1.p1 TRINITY_DN52512_c0_g1~~TRINITY_DN52512_c0_g1_i1.p1  ORF type:complete len:295 (+),score=29.96 TRINITY_DN52512_c0_g1_i1:77-961(+)
MASNSAMRRATTRSRVLMLGALMICGTIALKGSLTFVAPATSFESPSEVRRVWVSGPEDKMDVPRSIAEPRIVMYEGNKHPDRTATNGGGKHTITTNRKPVLGYSMADTVQTSKDVQSLERSGGVFARLRNMLEYDHLSMITLRQKHFRKTHEKGLWTRDYSFRIKRREKLQRAKESFESAWQQWLQVEGRRQGLTEPVKFDGPKLAKYLTPEMDAASEPDTALKNFPSKEERRTDPKWRKGKNYNVLNPVDLQPGKWNDDGDDNIFKIFKRPLHKYPVDVPMRSGKIHRGLVY